MSDQENVTRLPLPPDMSMPLFTYGSLKPGELAHYQIEDYVASTDSAAYLEGYVLQTRAGSVSSRLQRGGALQRVVFWPFP